MCNNKGFWPNESFRLYWNAYGGWNALLCSVYLWASVLLAFVTSVWGDNLFSWSESALSILPDILGFSLGGYAILVGFGDTEFLEALRGEDENGPSLYMRVNGAFVHFIVVESAALLWALISEALGISGCWLIKFIGFFLLFYTAATVLAATFAVLTMASWYDQKPKDS